jgi:hypothetical protein
MPFHSHTLRLRLSLLLAACLLFLGWFQLHHELTAHLEHPDNGCVVCVFTGHLGDGATASGLTLHAVHIPFRLDVVPGYTAPSLVHPFLHAFSQRGPPLDSSLI